MLIMIMIIIVVAMATITTMTTTMTMILSSFLGGYILIYPHGGQMAQGVYKMFPFGTGHGCGKV